MDGQSGAFFAIGDTPVLARATIALAFQWTLPTSAAHGCDWSETFLTMTTRSRWNFYKSHKTRETVIPVANERYVLEAMCWTYEEALAWIKAHDGDVERSALPEGYRIVIRVQCSATAVVVDPRLRSEAGVKHEIARLAEFARDQWSRARWAPAPPACDGPGGPRSLAQK